jgi:phage-related protein
MKTSAKYYFHYHKNYSPYSIKRIYHLIIKIRKMESTKTEIKQNATHIDSTVKAIENGVEKGSITGVLTTINSWIKTLESHPELKGIGSNLKKLKEAISAKNCKKIVELMTQLGLDTTKAAENAEGGEATKVKHLGKAITAAAKVIAKLL